MLRYEDAGVSIDTGDALVERIKPLAQNTHIPGVLAGIGGFGALFELPSGYQQPVLVSSTDGVGTKLLLASAQQAWDTLGQDLVAMCVNDILAQGAKPLFFLDYYATGKLNLESATLLIAGIARACQMAQMALVGGETAEMPGLYRPEECDVAGFAVGIIEKSQILPQGIQAGDLLIALPSTGPHANGYSLIRRILAEQAQQEAPLPAWETVLAPTAIYVKPLLPLLEADLLKGLAHITGGGITENIPRILPADLAVCIRTNSWDIPSIFQWIQEKGPVEWSEMYRTFNCGVGMVAVVSPENAPRVLQALAKEQAWVIGEVRPRSTPDTPPVQYEP